MFVRALTAHTENRGQATTWGSDWGGDSGSATAAGVPVTTTSSMQLLAVYGAVQLIVNEISTLPIDADPPPFWLDEPTPDLNRISWLGQILVSLLLAGNAFVMVLRGAGGIVAMIPLDPAKVTVRRENGRKVFYVNGAESTAEIIHISALMWPGADVGLSPIEYARQSIGLGIAAQQFGARYFDGDANMPGVIEMIKVATPGAKRELAAMWRRNRSRAGKGLPGILDDGATWKSTGVTNEQSQFLETRNFTAAEIVGQLFLLDPSDLGIAVPGTQLTYANLAQRNTRRVQVALMPWIRRLELAFSPYVQGGLKFNVDARLRGDTKESYETLAIAYTNGFLTLDEIREILNLDPLDEVPAEITQPPAKPGALTLVA